MNPRYLAYARAHGHTPEEQIAIDKAELPCACMLPYVEWNRARLVEYSKINPGAFTCGGLTDHPAYDAWLLERF